MKRFLVSILTVMAVFSLCTSAFASETIQKEEVITYVIMVNDQILDLSNLPLAPYEEGGAVMVPLRKISEALGYKVDWNSETAMITIDDGYIQKAVLFNKTATVTFEGRLQVINVSREIENVVETTIHDGCTYVPLEFFVEFFNDVTVENMTIKISPSKSELNTMDIE